jgi:hypothetical protein
MNQPPARRRGRASLALILCGVGGLAAVAAYVFLPPWRAQQSQDGAVSVEDAAVTDVHTAANTLVEGFRRALTLGLSPATLAYGTGGPADLAGALNLLPPPQPLSLAGVPAENSGRWFLGGGQLTGPYQAESPDVAFFLTPLPLDLCRKLNRTAWGNAASEPVATGIPLTDWTARKANMLEVFGGKNRSESCIATVEGKYLYYRLVYGTTVRDSSSVR